MEEGIKKEGIEDKAVITENVASPKKEALDKCIKKELDEADMQKIKEYFESENPDETKANNAEEEIPRSFTLQGYIRIEDVIKKLFLVNPFYLVSACLVLYASTRLFHTDNVFIDNLVPLAVMGIYTALLAGTSIFLGRIGKVWDDAGTLLQINVILFMAISVGLDGKVIDDTSAGMGWVAAGLAVMLAVSEMMFNGLKLKLPRIFRGAYYTLMSCYFIYPWILAELVTVYEKNKLPAIYGIMLFPLIGGLLFVLLVVPMIRKGPELFTKLGAPWKELRFPGNIFILIMLGFGFRTYLNTISFYGGRGVGPYSAMQTGFDAFMLIPLAAATAIILLEYGKSRQYKSCIFCAMVLPFTILLMGGASDNLFLKHTGHFSIPMLTALTSIITIYLYGWYKKICGSAIMSGIAFFVSAVVIKNVYAARLDNVELQGYGMIVFVTILLMISLLLMSYLLLRANKVLGGILIPAQIIISLWIILPESWIFKSYHGALPITVIYLALLIGSVFIRGNLGEVIRFISALAMPILCLVTIIYGSDKESLVTQMSCLGYTIMLLVVILTLAIFSRRMIFLACGATGASVIAIYGMMFLYNKIGGSGGRAMFWAIIFFIAALLLSMAKGKMYNKCFGRLRHAFNH
jgi:hypothetical protein